LELAVVDEREMDILRSLLGERVVVDTDWLAWFNGHPATEHVTLEPVVDDGGVVTWEVKSNRLISEDALKVREIAVLQGADQKSLVTDPPFDVGVEIEKLSLLLQVKYGVAKSGTIAHNQAKAWVEVFNFAFDNGMGAWLHFGDEFGEGSTGRLKSWIHHVVNRSK
jgi:hypothetical protein